MKVLKSIVDKTGKTSYHTLQSKKEQFNKKSNTTYEVYDTETKTSSYTTKLSDLIDLCKTEPIYGFLYIDMDNAGKCVTVAINDYALTIIKNAKLPVCYHGITATGRTFLDILYKDVTRLATGTNYRCYECDGQKVAYVIRDDIVIELTSCDWIYEIYMDSFWSYCSILDIYKLIEDCNITSDISAIYLQVKAERFRNISTILKLDFTKKIGIALTKQKILRG